MVVYLKAFITYLKAYVFPKFSDWQSMKSMTVSSMECVSTPTGTASRIWDRQLAPCFAGGSVRVQDDDHLPGELPWRVALPADSGSPCLCQD
jgi:hypothetical protein